MNEEERNDIPDGMDETPLYPQTVEGKIMEMRDIGAGLLESTDRLIEEIGHHRSLSIHLNAGPALRALGEHIVKLTTLTQLQTDTITQLYGELRGPGF
jgi:hypothetical protein